MQCYKWTGWEGLDGIVYLWAEESIDSIEHLTPLMFVSLMCSNGSVGSGDDHGQACGPLQVILIYFWTKVPYH